MTRSALVIGIGNAWRSDDGVGIAVAEQIAGRSLPNVQVLTAVSDPSELLDLWVTVDVTIIVDANLDRYGTPGVIRRHVNLAGCEPAGTTSSHGLTIVQALTLGAQLGRNPHQLVLYTVDVATVGPGVTLTPRVAAAVPAVVAAILVDTNPAGLAVIIESERTTNDQKRCGHLSSPPASS